jgi:hypothetical protein
MKISIIKYTERKNLGNYEHKEITAEAILEDGENTLAAIVNLRLFVQDGLHGSVYKDEVIPQVKVEEVVAEISIPAVKEKKTRAKKEKEVEVVEEEVIPEIPKEAKEVPAIPYNRDLDTHRQLLSSYLNNHHRSWKTAQGVKEFSMSLVGKPFLNIDGEVVESFSKLLSDFFNA